MTLATKKYRPVLSGLQLILLRDTLRNYLNSHIGDNRNELIKIYKIIANAATNAELDTGASYETVRPKQSIESMLGLEETHFPSVDRTSSNNGTNTVTNTNGIMTEAQILATLSEQERTNKLAEYQQQLLKELTGGNTNDQEI